MSARLRWLRAGAVWAAAVVTAGLSSASTGIAVLPPPPGSGPVTVFYPSDAAPVRVERGPFVLQLAPGAPPSPGNGRLIVMSHGSGGAPWPQADLAQALVAVGFTVAVPEHAGDNWHDMGDVGPVSWAHRPQEVSQAIDAMAADARFAQRLDFQRVGVYGMSAGGLAALTLAGARWSPAQLARHCDAHLSEDFPTCVGLATTLDGGLLDPLKRAIARTFIRIKWAGDSEWRRWDESRIAAVVAAVPMAAPIDLTSLSHPRVPLGLVRAGRDAWLAPQWHVDAVRAACGACVLVANMPEAGHGSVLSPQPIGLSPRAATLLNDPPGFDRASLAGVYRAITDFFVKNLGP